MIGRGHLHFPALRCGAIAAALLVLASCSPDGIVSGVGATVAAPKKMRPAEDEFSVMTYNLGDFVYESRDNSGRAAKVKTADEARAEIDVVSGASPDVLVCQETGDAAAFDKFRAALKERGLDYPHAKHLVMPGTATHIGLLSKLPVAACDAVTNEVFTTAGKQYGVEHGFLCADIAVNAGYKFKLVAAHLRSKRFVASGQTEMRRNEARLLNKVVRHLLRDKPDMNLLVIGDLSDSPNSAAVREVLGSPAVLADLRPADSCGVVWTHFLASDIDDKQDRYERNDFVLCNANMLRETDAEKCRVVEGPLVMNASEHRPVIAVFRAQDL